MKKHLLILTLLLVAGGLCGQQLALNAGLSMPLPPYNTVDVTKNDAGYATSGFNINLEYIFNASTFLGIGGMAFYNNNGFDAAELERQYNKLYHTDFVFTEARSWSSYGLLMGLYGYSSRTANIAFFARALVGIQFARSPEYTLIDSAWYARRLENETNNFIGLLGLGIHFLQKENLSLKISTDIMLSNPAYGAGQYTNASGIVVFKDPSSNESPFRVLNWSLGLVFKLSKRQLPGQAPQRGANGCLTNENGF